MQAVKVLQKSLEMAKASEEEIKDAYKTLSKDKVELESRVDTLEAKIKSLKIFWLRNRQKRRNRLMMSWKRPLILPGTDSGPQI